MISINRTNIDLSLFTKNWGWFLLWGVVLFALGIIAISAATFTTLVSVIFLGVIILLSGIVVVIDTFTFWWKKWSGFFVHLLIGVLYIVVGFMLIETPVVSAVSLTLLLGIFYILLGISRIAYSTSIQLPRWKWVLFNGLISLLLGVLILANWPASSLFIIGLFVGIDLLFCGIAYITMGFAARAMTKG